MNVSIKNIVRVFDDFFKIDRATLQYEKFNGQLSPELTRLNFNRGDSVGVLLYLPASNAVILTRQFRFPAYFANPRQGWLREIVAGMLETNENHIDTAKREVFEETGFTCDRLEYVAEFFLSPGGSSEKLYLFYGEITTESQTGTGGGILMEGEDIRVESIPLSAALKMVASGEICHEKTILALLWLEKKISVENAYSIKKASEK